MGRVVTDNIPKAQASKTQGQLFDDGTLWSDTVATWSDATAAWNGFYGVSSDAVPIISLSSSPIPSIAGYADIYTNIKPNNQKVVGCGWFLYVSQV